MSSLSDMTTPRLVLGCAPLGNLFRARSDEQAHEVLQAAWEAGVRAFDTAPHYGLGLAERRLGQFLADQPRDEFTVCTKVGRLIRNNPDWDGSAADDQGFAVPASSRRVWDVSRAGVRASLEESLERLGLERVDVLYLHDPEVSQLPRAVETGMESLSQLRAEGLVRRIGTGSLSVESHLAAVATGLTDTIMVANRYTLLNQSVAPELLSACDRAGARIMAAAVFNSGLLATRPSARLTYDYGHVPDDVLAKAIAIDEACAAHGVELGAAAVQYPLLDGTVEAVVVGADTAAQVRENVARLDVSIPDALWVELDERGLVPRCASR